MQYLNHLTDLGLRDEEARVYLALLKIGEAPASEVAAVSGFQRTAIYPLLNALTRKGFAGITIKKYKRFYHAERPTKLLRYFERRIKGFETVIPALMNLADTQASGGGIRYIETLPELQRFYKDVLDENRGKTYCIIGDAAGWEQLNTDFFIAYRKDRARANIKTRLLLTDQSRAVNPPGKALLRDCRFLPPGYTFKSTIDIYADKILVVNYKLSGLAVLIEIPGMVDIFQCLFDILWELMPREKM